MSYSDELRELINNTGVVNYKPDQAFEAFNGVEIKFLTKFVGGDYISSKNTDYEKEFPKAIEVFERKPPSSKYF